MEITATGIASPSERERALRAMAELCEEGGYGAITVEALIARAGISRPSFEGLFGDPEICLVAAVNSILGETMTAVSSSYSPDRSEWDSALRAIQEILELMASKPPFAYLAYITARQMAPAPAGAAREAGIRVVTAMIERLWDYSEAEVRAPTVARAAFGSTEAVVRREVAAGRAEQLPGVLPDLIYGATVPFLGQEDALRMHRRGRELLRGTPWE